MNDNETFNRLEQSMAAMRPKAMPADLLADLVDEMSHDDRRQRRGDRLLLTAMGSGVAAAVVIASMLWMQLAAGAPSPAGNPPVAAGAGPQRVGDYLAVYTRAGAGWTGIVK